MKVIPDIISRMRPPLTKPHTNEAHPLYVCSKLCGIIHNIYLTSHFSLYFCGLYNGGDGIACPLCLYVKKKKHLKGSATAFLLFLTNFMAVFVWVGVRVWDVV